MCIRSQHDCITIRYNYLNTLLISLYFWLAVSLVSIIFKIVKIRLQTYVFSCIGKGVSSLSCNILTSCRVLTIFGFFLTLYSSVHSVRVSSNLAPNPMYPNLQNSVTLDRIAPWMPRYVRTKGSKLRPTPLNEGTIKYTCHRLPDTCSRASYLRINVYHTACPQLPILYLLPHIDVAQVSSMHRYARKSCDGPLSDLRFHPSYALFHDYLATTRSCVANLRALWSLINETVNVELRLFDSVLIKSFCSANDTLFLDHSTDFQCNDCKTAYWNWLCSTTFPIFYPIAERSRHLTESYTSSAPSSLRLPVSTSPRHPKKPLLPAPLTNFSDLEARSFFVPPPKYSLVRVPACVSWCTAVETLCPYLNPSDSTSNGGEPAFLCNEDHYYFWPFERGVVQCENVCCYHEDDFKNSLNHADIETYDHQLAHFEPNCNSLQSRCRVRRKPDQGISLGEILPSNADLKVTTFCAGLLRIIVILTSSLALHHFVD